MPDIESRPIVSLSPGRGAEMPLTVISAGDALVGRLDICGNGQVLGTFDGELSCAGELLVGAEAKVRANIQAVNVILSGKVKGNVVARGRLKITTSGRLEGDAHVGSLVVQEGGVHYGLLQVYPEGLPEQLPERLAAEEPAAPQEVSAARPSLSKPIAASVDRVKKMWGELF